jgi:hypothetical protein
VSAGPARNRTPTETGPGPAVTRTVTDFLVVFLDRVAAGGGPWTSLQDAVAVVRGPGAADLRAVIDTGRYLEWEQMLDRLGDLGAAWRTPVLASLAVALRRGAWPGQAMRHYLLTCAQAEACAALPRAASAATFESHGTHAQSRPPASRC